MAGVKDEFGVGDEELEELELYEDHDSCDEDGTDRGCSRCEGMGLCPECGSASPWRCGCSRKGKEGKS